MNQHIKFRHLATSDQNAGQNHNIKTGNKSFETVEKFKYLGTILTYQNSAHEEIRSRLKSGNAKLSFGAESFVFQFATQRNKY